MKTSWIGDQFLGCWAGTVDVDVDVCGDVVVEDIFFGFGVFFVVTFWGREEPGSFSVFRRETVMESFSSRIKIVGFFFVDAWTCS